MSVSLCSQFAAASACSVRDGLSSGSSFQGPSSPLLTAPFARRDGYYGRASTNADRRLVIISGAKWKRPANSIVTRKPASGEKPSGEKASVEKPMGEKASVEKPVGGKASVEKPVGGKASFEKPVGGKASFEKPVGGKASFEKPVGGKASFEKPVGGKTSFEKPVGGKASFEKPVSGKASGDKPLGWKASVEKSSETGASVGEDSQPIWEEFVRSVSGEWDGYSAEFNMFGEPLELPSSLVPDAFLEWEQTIRDWQIQCPTLAHPEQGHLWYKIIRLLPTVGCEADAATVYSVENGDFQQTASALAYHKNGSYTTVWRGKRVTNEKQGPGPGKEVSREGDEIEVEQCLVHGKTRIRVLQKLGRRRHILIYREAWEGPFRNGESLGGCAGVMQAFASEKVMLTNSLFGKWEADIYTLKTPQTQQGYTSSHLVSSGTEVLEKTFASTFFYLGLPKDTWTVLLKTESGGTTIETGWLVQPDLLLVTKCEIGSSGELKDVSLRVEKRISSKVASVEASPEELEDLLTE